MKNTIQLLFVTSLLVCIGCEKSSDPAMKEGSVWAPPHSQPGIIQVPDRLTTHANPYAQRVNAGIGELEGMIAAYHDFFLVPEGTENKSLIPGAENKFSFAQDGQTVEYAYFDYVTSHRVFELEVKAAGGQSTLRSTGAWWPDWDSDAGRPETGKNYGTISYRTPVGAAEQNREFNWKDDGGGTHRVTLQIWNAGTNAGLAEKYEYQFNADKSGSFTYWEYRTNGGGDYIRANWLSDGSGSHIIGEGGHAVTNNWQ